MKKEMIISEKINNVILIIRGQKVILSSDLAKLYKVSPKALTQAVKRNTKRFPKDFMFQLNHNEFFNLKSQFVTSSWGGIRRSYPYAFTEQGVAMLSSVLKSKRAIYVNIEIMRTFAQLRRMISENKLLSEKLNMLEAKYDKQFSIVFKAIRELMHGPNENNTPEKPQIGFTNL